MVRPLPILLLALSWLWAAPAWAEPDAAAALRARVTSAVIAKWSPEVRFHTRETCFPTSAEALFKGAKAFRVGARETRQGGSRLLRTPSDLARLGPEWRIQFDPGNPEVKGGEVARARPDAAVTAPMYVSVQVAADASWVNLRYSFLFGFSGAQPMRSQAQGLTFIMPATGEHDGGWEGVDVRLAPDLQSVILVGTEAHGFRRRFQTGELDWTDSSHPQTRARPGTRWRARLAKARRPR